MYLYIFVCEYTDLEIDVLKHIELVQLKKKIY